MIKVHGKTQQPILNGLLDELHVPDVMKEGIQEKDTFCSGHCSMYCLQESTSFGTFGELCGTLGLLCQRALLFWIFVTLMLIGTEIWAITKLLSGIHSNHHYMIRRFSTVNSRLQRILCHG